MRSFSPSTTFDNTPEEDGKTKPVQFMSPDDPEYTVTLRELGFPDTRSPRVPPNMITVHEKDLERTYGWARPPNLWVIPTGKENTRDPKDLVPAYKIPVSPQLRRAMKNAYLQMQFELRCCRCLPEVTLVISFTSDWKTAVAQAWEGTSLFEDRRQVVIQTGQDETGRYIDPDWESISQEVKKKTVNATIHKIIGNRSQFSGFPEDGGVNVR